MKETLAKLGGRGGGSKDMAQGGPADAQQMGFVLAEFVRQLSSAR